MANNVVRSLADGQCRPIGLTDADIEAFVSVLFAIGYSPLTVRTKRQIAASFAQWTRQKQIAVADLDESHVNTFQTETSRRSEARDQVKGSALRLLLNHLRSEGRVPPPAVWREPAPVADIQERFERHLRRARGLSEQSVRTYRPFIQDFLAERAGSSGMEFAVALVSQDVQDFLLKYIPKQPTKTSKIMCTAPLLSKTDFSLKPR